MGIIQRQEYIDFFNGEEQLLIFHISDIHLWFSTTTLDILETKITLQKPDLILLTGDYYDTPTGARLFRTFLCKVSLLITVLFIKGNHDTIYGDKVSNLLLDIPNCFSVEDTVYTFISKQGYRYNITSWSHKKHLPDSGSDKNVVLIHNPEKIDTNELSKIDLILAGHLHGGQFIFFKTKKGDNFPGCLLYTHCTDRKQLDNTTLIVSKGLGDTFPVRFNCPKEIVKITIT